MTATGSTRIVCDSCERGVAVENPERVVFMAPPWRIVRVPGWVGDFHACSDACATELAARYERPLPIASEAAEREDDTTPSIPVPRKEP